MKKIFVLMVVLLVLAVMASPASAIIGGDQDSVHTNVGAIMMEWPQVEGDPVGRLCSGTLIHERALLTAAHCYQHFENQGITYDQIWVTFDQDPFAADAEYLVVEAFVAHDEFNLLETDSHDIALVILKDPVDGIETEALPDIEYMDTRIDQNKWQKLQMLIVGYGVTDLNSRTRSEILSDAERMSGSVTYKDMMEYKIEILQISNLDNAFYAAGDSGGPLFYKESDTNEVMMGLGSCFDPACMSLKGLFYRLDTNSARAWIYYNLPDE